jgi:uncharacterized protein (TIGR02145 family)
MKKILIGVLVPLIFFVVINSCSKKDVSNPGGSGGGNNTPTVPSLTTINPTNISFVSAESGGTITSDGKSVITARGICWSLSPNPTISDTKTSDGTGIGTYSSSLSSLTPGTFYYIRAYATNSTGTGYGDQLGFKTIELSVPIILANPTVSTATLFGATGSGNIINDGGSPVISRGICWSATHTPTTADNVMFNGSGSGNFTGTILGLSANTTYYVRLFATNVIGTNYGQLITILTDVEGNVYNTVQIGSQLWMKENLRTTKYNNGTNIPYVANDVDWAYFTSLAGPKFCWFGNNSANKNIYGGLYNWHVINTGIIAPVGWHVPTHSEFITFVQTLDPDFTQEIVPFFSTTYLRLTSHILGEKMKDTGYMHWQSPNTGANNSSGFAGFGGGLRQDLGGNCDYFQIFGGWWSSTEILPNNCYRLILTNTSEWLGLYGPEDKGEGLSIRCVKN